MNLYMKHVNFVPVEELDIALQAFELKQDSRTRKVFTLTHPSLPIILDEISFFEAAVTTFPTDPLINRNALHEYNTGSFIDSLHGGIRGVNEQIIDVVWPEVDVVAQKSLPTLITGAIYLHSFLFGFLHANFNRRAYTRLLLTFKASNSLDK